MNLDRLRQCLSDLSIGSPLYYFDTVDSTNSVGAELARENAPEGTLILADSQTAGRGRLQRLWQSPPGTNLYFSVILRPDTTPAEAALLTLVGGVAACDAISGYCLHGVEIKWPNDILIHGRKVCGILTEMKTDGQRIEAVMGIGINVNITNEDFMPEHRPTATSLFEATGAIIAREELLCAFCRRFQFWYQLFLTAGFTPIREAWLSKTGMVGKRVGVRFRDEIREGLVSGIDHDGALLLVDSDNTVWRITAGDATILK